jgi:hypothetical protein
MFLDLALCLQRTSGDEWLEDLLSSPLERIAAFLRGEVPFFLSLPLVQEENKRLRLTISLTFF